MAGRKMDASELAAAEIVAAYLEGRQEPRDVETARDGTHDFDVLLNDGRRVALEVTAAGGSQAHRLRRSRVPHGMDGS